MVTNASSKGGSSLSQAFMNNTATPHQPAQLPTIAQPQREPLPQIAPQPVPQPTMGSMAPAVPPGLPFGMNESRHGGQAADDKQRRRQQMFYDIIMAGRQPQQQAAPSQPSQAQLLARAINERAQGGQ